MLLRAHIHLQQNQHEAHWETPYETHMHAWVEESFDSELNYCTAAAAAAAEAVPVQLYVRR